MLNKKTIWVCRHGNRIDFINKGWQPLNGYDPHLSQDGIEQAKRTGERLLNESISCIFSSPFSRTLETAHLISEIINAPIFIEKGFTEWLNEEWFSYNPKLKNVKDIKSKFPNVNSQYHSLHNPQFPETYEQCIFRTSNTTLSLSNSQKENILIISHCLVIPGISKPLLGYFFEDNFDLCSLTKIEYNNYEWSCKIKNDTQHLL